MKFPPSKVPEKDRVPFWQKLAYGLGGPVEGTAIWIPQANLMPVFNVALGMNPAVLGMILMLWRAWDGCADLVMGNLSDNARTPWGRRRPFIVLGAILTALFMPAIWWMPSTLGDSGKFFWLLLSGIVFYSCYTVWAMPYYSLQLEMTPDYNERTNVTAYRAFVQQLINLAAGWILAWAASPMFSRLPGGKADLANGMRYISLVLALVTLVFGVLPGLFVVERYYEKDARKQPREGLWAGLRQTLSTRPFLCIVAIVLTKTFGLGSVNALGFYINSYYVCRGDLVKATIISGMISSLLFAPNLLAIPFCTWLANRFGKQRLLYFTVGSAILGLLSMFICVTPAHPWWQLIPPLLIGPTGIGLWLVVPSMQADVADYDEPAHRPAARRQLFRRFLMDVQGLQRPDRRHRRGDGGLDRLRRQPRCGAGAERATAHEMVLHRRPSSFSGRLLVAIRFYDLNKARMQQIRLELEARRGSL